MLFDASEYFSAVRCALNNSELIPLGDPNCILGIPYSFDKAALIGKVFPPAATRKSNPSTLILSKNLRIHF